MATLLADDDAEFLLGSGSILGGQPIAGGETFVIQTPIGFVPQVAQPTPFLLPDLYEYYPVIVRAQDQTLVDRPAIPLYTWDTVPQWDVTPFTWDAVIDPEPILKSTTRVMQLELERTAIEIRDLCLQWNPSRTPRDRLPYIAQMLGTPLPFVDERAQRTFITELVNLYKNKGTLVSFNTLFLSLGFRPVLTEQYQRKSDADFVSGPQAAVVSTSRVVREPSATTLTVSPGPYIVQMMKKPVIRGSVQLLVYDQSAFTPTIINDDGEGGWKNLNATTPIPGSIDYVTGRADFTLPTPPTNIGGDILINYAYLTDPFPDPYKRRWVDRFRSSYVRAQLFPQDPTVVLTLRLVQRMQLYLALLKPAHVLIDALEVVFPLEDDEGDTLQDQGAVVPPLSFLFVEHVFGTPYHGYGYAYPPTTSWDDNGSLSPINANGKDRVSGEMISMGQDPVAADLPYTYPFKVDGRSYNPNAAENWEFIGDAPKNIWERTVVAGAGPATTTTFSVDSGVVPANIGPGSFACFTGGGLQGEKSIVTVLDTGPGVRVDITVSPALPLIPQIGDTLTFLEPTARTRNGLVDRPQDPLELHMIPVIPGPPTVVPLGDF